MRTVPFRSILGGFAAQHPHVLAVVFCDEEGERVESIVVDTAVDPYELDVLGASLAPLAPTLARQGSETCVRVLRARDVIWVRSVSDRYYVVAWARRASVDARIGAGLDDVAHALRAHM